MCSIRSLFVSLLLFITIACAPLPARYDYDLDADFSQYETYQWQKSAHKSDVITDNSLLEKRIQAIASRHLEFRNINQAEGNPDFFLTYQVVTRERFDVRDYGNDYFWPYRYGRTTDVYQYTEGTLIIDMIDAKTGKLVWRGWTNRTIDQPSIPEALLEQLLGKIFEKFPL